MTESTTQDLNSLDIGELTKGLLENFKTVEDMLTDFSKNHAEWDLDPFNLGELYSAWFAADHLRVRVPEHCSELQRREMDRDRNRLLRPTIAPGARMPGKLGGRLPVKL